jgi:hypothetical protein
MMPRGKERPGANLKGLDMEHNPANLKCQNGTSSGQLVQARQIEQAILLIRSHRVMLSPDLAVLYGVEPRAVVQAVKRNLARFPDDFVFQLTKEEWRILKSQSVISSWGGARAAPYAFTEQGVAMLSSVLRSTRAVQVNVEIMRAFVRLRRILADNAGLARRLDELEKKYDVQFKVVFDALRKLMQPPEPQPRKRRIGFGPDDDRASSNSDFIARDRPRRRKPQTSRVLA